MVRVLLTLVVTTLILSLSSSRTYAADADTSRDLPLGQLLIIGFKGTDLNEGLGDVIRETKPGGILLFGRNVKSAEQVAKLNFNAQSLSKKVSNTPLLIAIDQEGGNVIRIRHTPNLPSALAISRTRDLTVAHRAGAATGRLLKSLGINMNLAPVVDVSDPDTDHFLGTRSFGNDPKRVAAMTTALATGLQENGVLPVAKHFPGHGDASGDSHLVAATSPADRETLFARDLVPYMSLAKTLKKPWGAMLAHVSFPAVDESGSPATFSKPIVSGIFRQDISASALVMTDDIEMAGAGTEKNVGLRAVRAIEAGADMVMIAWSRKIQKEVTTALHAAVQSGKLKRSRIEEALRHIARAKSVYVPKELKLATKDELTRSLKNPEFQMLGNAVLRAAARNLDERRLAKPSVAAGETDKDEKRISTGSSDDEGTSPASATISRGTSSESSAEVEPTNTAPSKLKAGDDPVILLSARLDFLNAFRARAIGHKVISVVLKPSRKEAIQRLMRSHPESSVFVYVSGHQVANFVSGLDEEFVSRMILVNVETRASIEHPERFRDIFDVHYRHPELGTVVAESYLELAPLSSKRTAASLQSEQTP